MKSTKQALTLNTVLKEEYRFIAQEEIQVPEKRFVVVDWSNLKQKVVNARVHMLSPTLEAPEDGYERTAYSHLVEWAGDEALTEEYIQQVLTNKAKEDDLLKKETWLCDAALRPYTRGLVTQYLDQSTLFTQVRELNQLLLEDAFAEHILPEDSSDLTGIFDKLLDRSQSALCLSGGGIRSATFGLGVIQGLAQQGVLDKFNYMSTVSGGGYVGSWLSAWAHHAGFDQVIAELRKKSDTPIATEAAPIRHLRQYSNYLSPQLGFFSADTWTLIATYIRNLLLVWLVIMPFLAALMAAPWIAVTIASFDPFKTWPHAHWVLGIVLLLGFSLAVYAVRFIHAFIPELELPVSDKPKKTRVRASTRFRDQNAFIRKCLLPLLGSLLLLMLVWMWSVHSSSSNPWILEIRDAFNLDSSGNLTIGSVGGWCIMGGAALAHFLSWLLARPTPKSPGLQLAMAVTVMVTGVIAGLLMLVVTRLLPSEMDASTSTCFTPATISTALSFPCFLFAILLAGYFFEGITSRYNNDPRREWTARYSAWVLLAGVSWLLLTSLALFGPKLMDTIESRIATLGLSSSLLTGLLGWSSKTAGGGTGAGSRNGKGNAPTLLGLVAKFTLPIVSLLTLIILLVTLSRLDLSLFRLISIQLNGWYGDDTKLVIPDYETIPFYIPLGVCLLLAVVGYVLGLGIDTNRFSLHAMYRARLIRAYLGASRPQSERRPDPFTGFDEKDNIYMGNLALEDETLAPPGSTNKYKKGPFHILNLALNVTSGQNLAWQERKAESFSVSPLHAGALNLGYRRTRPEYKASQTVTPVKRDSHTDTQYYGGEQGISLGTAMTTSGAAASPNMGYHSSPLVAFLMTLLNARLGWWLGNPGPAGDKTFFRRTPKVAITPIRDELFGLTDDVNPYVYLSDGGHFENLGLYEMVLRRNRFIIVSDASCDENCTLEDLGNAIRKIRIDLGIPIEFSSGFNISARSATPPADGKPGAYWSFGRIHYSAVDKREGGPDATDGLLLYIKPAFYGKDEPRDVFNYALTQVAFPHESTGDQFFSESQFESYRALGNFIVGNLAQSLKSGITLPGLFEKDGPQKFWDSQARA